MRIKFLIASGLVVWTLGACVSPAHAVSGLGTATVLPLSVVAGGVATSTLSFVVPSTGMAAGGRIEVSLPANWYPYPQTTNPSGNGYVTVGSTQAVSWNVTVYTTAPVVTATLSGGSLTPYSVVQFVFQNVFVGCPLPSQTAAAWLVRSATDNSTLPSDIAASPVQSFATGSMSSLAFVPWNPLSVVAAQPAGPVVLEAQDFCGKPVNVPTPVSVALSGFYYAGSTTLPDPSALFSTSASMTPSTTTVVVSSGSSQASFYYQTNQIGNSIWINANYYSPVYASTQTISRSVNSFSSLPSFSNVSIDNGSFVSGQTSASLSPDNDGTNELVFIRFTPSDTSLTWRVTISSSGFSNVVFERWGSGSMSSGLTWDGRHAMAQNSIAPNGTYSIKIEYPDLVQNTALSVALNTSFISGRVTLGGVGIASAFVNAQGASSGSGYSFGQTDTSGNYVLYGLRSGSAYNLYANFTSSTTQIPLNAWLNNVTAPATNQNFSFSLPGTIRVAATLATATPIPLYGTINAHTSNYSNFYSASIRFQSGATTSDNNDPFQPSTWSVLGVVPGTYLVTLMIPGMATSSQTVTVSAGQTQSIVQPMVSKATVYGKIHLPAPAASPLWVPVEATLQSGTQPLYFGGASFSTGHSTAVYAVYGVDPGNYNFRARPPNYLPAVVSTTVASTNIGDPINGGLNFSSTSFTTGGQLSGNVTLSGDSTGVSNPTVYLNMSAQSVGLYFNQALSFTPNATSVTIPYTQTGMADGTYQVFPWLPGFETVPPGPKTATVSGGAGTLNITLAAVSGQIAGNVLLPGANSDYTNVHLSLMGMDSREIDLTSGPGYTIQKLPTGQYNLKATYLTTGAQVRHFISVTNGQTTTQSLDFRSATYAINGTVSVTSGFTMRDSSNNNVSIATLTELLSKATTSNVTIGGTGPSCSGGTTSIISTVRVEAFPRFFGGFHDPTRSGFNNCFGVGEYKYGTVASNGAYTISGLTPGVWEVQVYPYFDGGTVPNVAVTKKVITITASNQTVDFGIGSGYDVAGTLSLPPGITDTRSFDVEILSSRGASIQKSFLNIGTGQTPASSVNFLFSNLADGDYSLVIREWQTWDPQLGFVTKYVGKPLGFTVSGADVSGLSMTLSRAARIVGKLAVQGKNPDGTPSVTVISANNSSLLPSNFRVSAQAFPWVEGGFGSAQQNANHQLMLDSNDQWRIEGLIGGTYDISFRQDTFGGSASGQGSLNLASLTKAQIRVVDGQTLDLGTITLTPGLSVSGTVEDTSGNPLANIRVRAQAAFSTDHNGIETTTDGNGQYTLMGLSPSDKIYNIEAAPRPSGNDSTPAVPYQNVKKRAVDVTVVPTPTVDFTLASAQSSITGQVLTEDSGPLSYPESDNAGYPAAAVYLKQQGVVGGEDPLGEIHESTELDGSFRVDSLVPGTYVMTIASLGYRPYKQTIVLGTGSQSIGNVTLENGPHVAATLAKPNGSAVSTSDVRFAVGVTADVGSVIFGQITSDANTQNISEIVFDGFELNKRYSILLFDQLDNIIQPPEGRNLMFTSDSDSLELALTYQPGQPSALTHVRKSGNDVIVEYYFTRPLRNTQTFDQDPTNFVSLTKGAGTLSGQSLSGDRRSMVLTYTPSLNEQTATLTLLAYSTDVDPTTNTEYPIQKTSTLLFGQKASAESAINPALGGDVSLAGDNDPSSVTLPANALLNSDGTAAGADESYNISFNATDDISGLSSASPGARAATLSVAMQRGARAYLSEAWAAMQSARASSTLNPFSAFYSVLLPSGLSHTLNQSATLTLNYSDGVDPNTINVYFFDGTKYLIEKTNRQIDTVNKTITVSVSHFSTFVVLQNSASVVTVDGDSASTPDIEVFNFPNPFDLTTKTKTIARGGTTTSLSTDGTIIRYTIPAAKRGASKIVIYNVVGEKVRTIDLGTPTADTYHYVTWDGRNDSGNKVASGVYVGLLKSGDHKRFFKMAVIK